MIQDTDISAGTGLIYSTYLAGHNNSAGNPGPFAIAIDGSGHAYVTGYTAAPDFPTTPGAFQTSYGGKPTHSSAS